ncbi:MAG TPA: GerMN domain-containing protein [Roseiflexaceae bacterium]|nr:GerMN domain-containing protein [Roseiflexaceae bacterium]
MTGATMLKRVGLLLGALVLALALLPARPAAGQIAVAEQFRSFYTRGGGERVLGPPISELVIVADLPAQYFEKGRLEDHRAALGETPWGLMFGRLTAELMERAPEAQVSGTPVTYSRLAGRHSPAERVPPPPGFRGGTVVTAGGVFVPYDPQLRPAPGYLIPLSLWRFMTRADLFPHGWLHAFGLPMTPAFETAVVKGGRERVITMQAFERTVLTHDPQNPAAWRAERANLGQDALRALGHPPPAPVIDQPLPGEIVTMPVHIQARVGQPGESITALLRWADGIELSHTFTVLPSGGPAGSPGWVIGSMMWPDEGMPTLPTTQRATLELRAPDGRVLARQPLTVLPYGASGTRTVVLYYLIQEELIPLRRTVPATPAIATATLNQLLWPPIPGNLAGYTTAIPTPEEVLTYGGREPGWGPRVRLLGLTINNGVATANLSPEIRAYGGGSARVQHIRDQITRTLMQFPTVRTVRIAVAGQIDGVLQP